MEVENPRRRGPEGRVALYCNEVRPTPRVVRRGGAGTSLTNREFMKKFRLMEHKCHSY